MLIKCLSILILINCSLTQKCPQNIKINLNLICYYSEINDKIDACNCTHIVLPENSLKTEIRNVKENFRNSKVLLTVSAINQNFINVLKNNTVDGIEINLKKIHLKSDITDLIKTIKSKINSNLIISVALPTKAEVLAKFYDLKTLTKETDFFILQTAFLNSDKNVTFHPSRLTGLWDMQNTDSIIDLVYGLGVPLSKLVITAPVQALEFALQDAKLTEPGSPAKTIKSINRDELCAKMKSDTPWVLERDQDQTSPYIFHNNAWIAFEDETSIDIKVKYARIRGLGGFGLKDLSQDSQTCSLLKYAYEGLSKQSRAPRRALLQSLKREIAETPSTHSKTIQISPYTISRVIDVEGNIHSLRKDTRTEFECSRQGYFVHPRSCNRFYRCVKFDQLLDDFNVFEFDCPEGLMFDGTTEVCVWPGSLAHSSACSGSTEIAPVPKTRFNCPINEGYYADPENCRWFFACLDHGKSILEAYEFRCPFGLVFDEQNLLCEWSWLVPSCAGLEAVDAFLINDGARLQTYDGLGSLKLVQFSHQSTPNFKKGFTNSAAIFHKGKKFSLYESDIASSLQQNIQQFSQLTPLRTRLNSVIFHSGQTTEGGKNVLSFVAQPSYASEEVSKINEVQYRQPNAGPAGNEHNVQSHQPFRILYPGVAETVRFGDIQPRQFSLNRSHFKSQSTPVFNIERVGGEKLETSAIGVTSTVGGQPHPTAATIGEKLTFHQTVLAGRKSQGEDKQSYSAEVLSTKTVESYRSPIFGATGEIFQASKPLDVTLTQSSNLQSIPVSSGSLQSFKSSFENEHASRLTEARFTQPSVIVSGIAALNQKSDALVASQQSVLVENSGNHDFADYPADVSGGESYHVSTEEGKVQTLAGLKPTQFTASEETQGGPYFEQVVSAGTLESTRPLYNGVNVQTSKESNPLRTAKYSQLYPETLIMNGQVKLHQHSFASSNKYISKKPEALRLLKVEHERLYPEQVENVPIFKTFQPSSTEVTLPDLKISKIPSPSELQLEHRPTEVVRSGNFQSHQILFDNRRGHSFVEPEQLEQSQLKQEQPSGAEVAQFDSSRVQSFERYELLKQPQPAAIVNGLNFQSHQSFYDTKHVELPQVKHSQPQPHFTSVGTTRGVEDIASYNSPQFETYSRTSKKLTQPEHKTFDCNCTKDAAQTLVEEHHGYVYPKPNIKFVTPSIGQISTLKEPLQIIVTEIPILPFYKHETLFRGSPAPIRVNFGQIAVYPNSQQSDNNFKTPEKSQFLSYTSSVTTESEAGDAITPQSIFTYETQQQNKPINIYRVSQPIQAQSFNFNHHSIIAAEKQPIQKVPIQNLNGFSGNRVTIKEELQQQPAIISTYDLKTIKHDINISPTEPNLKVSQLAFQQPLYTPSNINVPVPIDSPPVIQTLNLQFNVPNSEPTVKQKLGYYYPKPAITFNEGPKESYYNKKPVKEQPFVANHTYVTYQKQVKIPALEESTSSPAYYEVVQDNTKLGNKLPIQSIQREGIHIEDYTYYTSSPKLAHALEATRDVNLKAENDRQFLTETSTEAFKISNNIQKINLEANDVNVPQKLGYYSKPPIAATEGLVEHYSSKPLVAKNAYFAYQKQVEAPVKASTSSSADDSPFAAEEQEKIKQIYFSQPTQTNGFKVEDYSHSFKLALAPQAAATLLKSQRFELEDEAEKQVIAELPAKPFIAQSGFQEINFQVQNHQSTAQRPEQLGYYYPKPEITFGERLTEDYHINKPAKEPLVAKNSYIAYQKQVDAPVEASTSSSADDSSFASVVQENTNKQMSPSQPTQKNGFIVEDYRYSSSPTVAPQAAASLPEFQRFEMVDKAEKQFIAELPKKPFIAQSGFQEIDFQVQNHQSTAQRPEQLGYYYPKPEITFGERLTEDYHINKPAKEPFVAKNSYIAYQKQVDAPVEASTSSSADDSSFASVVQENTNKQMSPSQPTQKNGFIVEDYRYSSSPTVAPQAAASLPEFQRFEMVDKAEKQFIAELPKKPFKAQSDIHDINFQVPNHQPSAQRPEQKLAYYYPKPEITFGERLTEDYHINKPAKEQFVAKTAYIAYQKQVEAPVEGSTSSSADDIPFASVVQEKAKQTSFSQPTQKNGFIVKDYRYSSSPTKAAASLPEFQRFELKDEAEKQVIAELPKKTLKAQSGIQEINVPHYQPTAQRSEQTLGYYYPKPEITFGERLTEDHYRKQPALEEPFVAKKAYLTYHKQAVGPVESSIPPTVYSTNFHDCNNEDQEENYMKSQVSHIQPVQDGKNGGTIVEDYTRFSSNTPTAPTEHDFRDAIPKQFIQKLPTNAIRDQARTRPQNFQLQEPVQHNSPKQKLGYYYPKPEIMFNEGQVDEYYNKQPAQESYVYKNDLITYQKEVEVTTVKESSPALVYPKNVDADCENEDRAVEKQKTAPLVQTSPRTGIQVEDYTYSYSKPTMKAILQAMRNSQISITANSTDDKQLEPTTEVFGEQNDIQIQLNPFPEVSSPSTFPRMKTKQKSGYYYPKPANKFNKGPEESYYNNQPVEESYGNKNSFITYEKQVGLPAEVESRKSTNLKLQVHSVPLANPTAFDVDCNNKKQDEKNPKESAPAPSTQPGKSGSVIENYTYSTSKPDSVQAEVNLQRSQSLQNTNLNNGKEESIEKTQEVDEVQKQSTYVKDYNYTTSTSTIPPRKKSADDRTRSRGRVYFYGTQETPTPFPIERYIASKQNRTTLAPTIIPTTLAPKQKTKTYVRFNNYNSPLTTKLGAECVCTTKTLTLRRQSSKTRIQSDSEVIETGLFEPTKTTLVDDAENYTESTSKLPKNVERKRLIRIRPVVTTPVAKITKAEKTQARSAETTSAKPARSKGRNRNHVVAHAKCPEEKSSTPNQAEKITSVAADASTTMNCQRAGLFRHPEKCNKFYACRWDDKKNKFTLHVFNCPVHLTFDYTMGACNWPSKGPACTKDTLLFNEK